jgi:hypothetical protein
MKSNGTTTLAASDSVPAADTATVTKVNTPLLATMICIGNPEYAK